MARPKKNTAEYFSHDAHASEDERLLRLESRYGIAAYGFFFKMLELLCQNENFEISEPDEWWFSLYSQKWNIKETAIKDIFEDALSEKIKLFEKKDGKIFSQSLKNRMEPLLKRRERDRQNCKKGGADFCARVPDAENPVLDKENIVSVVENPPKVKEMKEKKNKEEEMHTLSDEKKFLENSQKIEIQKSDEKKIISAAEKVFAAPKKMTDEARKKFRARLKNFTADEIAAAFRNLEKEPDKWKILNNGFRSLSWWLKSDDRILEMQNCHLKKISAQNRGGRVSISPLE